MAKNHANKVVKNLRNRFTFGTRDTAQYFPGHMAKGMKQIQQKLINVDCIIEVHDARIPITGRNPVFKEKVLVRPHVLLFNKMDLADLTYKSEITNYYKNQGIAKVIFANCKEQVTHTIKKRLIPTVLDLIGSGSRYNRAHAEDYRLLIIGVPNVGKSSLINAMRRNVLGKGKATSVGGVAGVTKSVLEKILVCEQPPIYVLDTPGILQPKIPDIETGMKLAACANLKDHLVGETMIADYILYWLNANRIFDYVNVFDLDGPTDDILEVLSNIAIRDDYFLKKKTVTQVGLSIKPDFNRAAQKFISAFRRGEMGKVNLDEDKCKSLADKDITTLDDS